MPQDKISHCDLYMTNLGAVRVSPDEARILKTAENWRFMPGSEKAKEHEPFQRFMAKHDAIVEAIERFARFKYGRGDHARDG